MKSSAFVLYSRERCPLCDEAKVILEEVRRDLGVQYKEIDIHSDDALLEKFALMIPVIEWKEEIVQFGKVDISALKKLLQK
ncbi:glutaredoxin family protein [Peribacillus muralis]|uniref:glutaredoxin family protein n=1 Tax=Peribacillus muralis TaxID=264697 RepID=UPI00070C44AF|nr:glutaredoxin family protein [Peribacillus muralis]MCK1994398.1 glutaredoxin family protein [Peribacillus muralis]MCK2014817.1 glutaredoxin family protein [Peribacillus muralis]